MIRGSVEEPHREWTSGPNKTDSILSELEMKRQLKDTFTTFDVQVEINFVSFSRFVSKTWKIVVCR